MKNVIFFLVAALMVSALYGQVTSERAQRMTETGGVMEGVLLYGRTKNPADSGEKDSLDPSGIPLPPENLTITLVGNDVILEWDPVTLDTNLFPIDVDGYSIYLRTTPVGTYVYHDSSPLPQYSHVGVLNYQQRVFYRVRAIKN